MLRVGVIGYGHFGPNLARCLAATPGVSVTMVSDAREERLAIARRDLPGAWTTVDCTEPLTDPSIDAIVVATPVASHYELARMALRHGKHVLVEKPIAASSAETCRLIDEAARRRLVLMVDHTFVFSGAVRKMQELVGDGVADVLYYDSVRANLGRVQPDVDVLWDLAVHDLAIIESVLRQPPRAVSAIGARQRDAHPARHAYLTLTFDGPLIAHLHASWLSPVKIRRTVLGGTERTIVYDDLEPRAKIRVHGASASASAHAGDVPELDNTEPLRAVAQHFVACIASGAKPCTDGLAGLATVRVLEAATRSMAEDGRFVDLTTSGVGF